ncbi:Suf-domain-containing protein [Polyplosphaeria fusca]|uniref:mRNA 3'-end-processing protein RNA14 n=1 Tax=Polyplosphaeria fusca TaxID=682080 RepID=A0A9P4QT41_9PLEO|nr:Suf-domain-containing protein [Polyplosphaeria fusca]
MGEPQETPTDELKIINPQPTPEIVNNAESASKSIKPQPAESGSAALKQPRTKGGFIDESEDEDENDNGRAVVPGSALLNPEGAAISPPRSISRSPNNNITNKVETNKVEISSTPILGFAGVPPPSTATDDATAALAPSLYNGGTQAPNAQTATSTLTSVPQMQTRLPQDKVGIFEDRIAEDPRGDVEAWLGLIEEHRRRHKIDEARAVYERFFKVFPGAADQWAAYINMESELGEFTNVEKLLNTCLVLCPHVTLWKTYLDYIRRRNNLTTDETGNARRTIMQVYEFTLDHVGIDYGAGQIWLDYIQFVKSAPGTVGGNTWADQQKMDMLRKAYQRATAVPTPAIMEIWREYDKFERGLNKITGPKALQDRSPFYITAQAAHRQLDQFYRGIDRTTLPKLPPVQGFAGYEEYMAQVQLWNKWIGWEKSDQLFLAEKDAALFKKRIVYVYKHALMALRFWPQLWFDAAEWCLQNGLDTEGNQFLDDGLEANPESSLLAFRKANQIELFGDFEDGEAGSLRKGEAVRKPFDKVLDALYELANQTKKREETTLQRMKQQYADDGFGKDGESDDYEAEDDAGLAEKKQKQKQHEDALNAISQGFQEQMNTLKKAISYVWIALMRTMRRIQGKGRPDPQGGVPGFRAVFGQARKRGKLVSDVYVTSALIEHQCYQDPAATKIFDRGMKLFPDDEHFALEYIKHLIKQNDATNARAVFETVVSRLTQKPELVERSKALFQYFHQYESQYGELTQIVKLEKRMREYFPQDPQLQLFAERYSSPLFDPTQVRPIISPLTQTRPKIPAIMQTVEEPFPTGLQPQMPPKHLSPVLNSPRITPALLGVTNSPKRPFEDVDNELNQPRKLVRGESPLKGAAGRRLDAARARNQAPGSPAPLPNGINFLLSVLPSANSRDLPRLDPNVVIQALHLMDQARTMPQVPVNRAVPTPPVAGYWAPPPPQHLQHPPQHPPHHQGGYYGR